MNRFFKSFTSSAAELAESRGVNWTVLVNNDGSIGADQAWDVTKIAGATPPPRIWLKDMGTDKKTLQVLAGLGDPSSESVTDKRALSSGWQELIKAAVIDRALRQRNQPAPILNSIVRPLRVIATCVSVEPWNLNKEHIEYSCRIADTIQKSGKLGDDIRGVVRTIVDANHISDHGPLAPGRLIHRSRGRSTQKLRRNLDDRKRVERLPVEDAFWEIVRIIWSEKPQSFLDLQKFALLKVLILCGFRGGEAARIPLDWERGREYFDIRGRKAGEAGGISKSLMLRHFAEKQRTAHVDGIALFEAYQHIPTNFELPIIETLRKIEAKTEPLRNRLREQIHTGRIFPELATNDRVPVVEMYTRLTGGPFAYTDDRRPFYIEKYRDDLDASVLTEIEDRQRNLREIGAPLNNQVRIYLGTRLGSTIGRRAPFRDVHGDLREDNDQSRVNYGSDHFIIGELEEFLRAAILT